MYLAQRLRQAAFLAVATAFVAPMFAQGPLDIKPETRITAKVDNTVRTTLTGNTHPLTKTAPDLGPVDGTTPMLRMILMLTHSDAQEAALNTLLAQQQDKNSPNYHNWLTPTQFGQKYGASDADIKTVSDWLTGQGFTISKVGPGKNYIEFNGTATQVSATFQTPIHKYSVDGYTYQANAADPSIPSALASVVKGVLSLHNFPQQMHHVTGGIQQTDPQTGKIMRHSSPADSIRPTSAPHATTNGSSANFVYNNTAYNNYVVTPYDFATIYNVIPLWNAGIDGTGQTIALAEETDIHIDDVRNFRSIFGLPAKDPVIILNGPDPGVTTVGEEGEAILDTEWAGAVAKNATVDVITSESTVTTYGTALSAIYAVDYNVSSILSLSYGQCEPALGSTGNAYWSALWQQGDAQGMSILVSSGDSGSDCTDRGLTIAGSGINVSGYASTPYNTAVGGTDFMGTFVNTPSFWSATNNGTTEADALGYIPETTWNDNCTNGMYEQSILYIAYANAAAACNATSISQYKSNYYTLGPDGSSGGGPSTYSTKPSWQSGTGVPADGARDIPDVSLFAASGGNLDLNLGYGNVGSSSAFCQEDYLGAPCSITPTLNFGLVGGTSIATPNFAGIVALIDQKTGSKQGLINYVLYDLFAQQIASGTACASNVTGATYSSTLKYSTGTAVLPASTCIFNDIVNGSNSAACTKNSTDCTTTGSNTYGILTTLSNQVPASATAFLNTVGYDEATGLGTVNAANLVNSWSSVTFLPTTTTLSLASTTFAHGTSVNATVAVTPTSGGGATPTGLIQLDTNTFPAVLGPATLSAGTVTQAYNDYPGGTYNVTAYYAGDGTYAPSTSTPVFVTVTPENSTVTGSIYTESFSTAYNSATTSTYGGYVLINETVAGASGHGTPSGTVTFVDGGATFSTQTLDSAGIAGYATTTLPAGTYSFTANYSGDSSFNASSTTAANNLVIAKSATKLTPTKGSSGTVAAGVAIKFSATLVGNNAATIGNYGPAGPTGTVSFYETGTSGATTGGTLMGTAGISAYTSAANANTGLYTITGTAAAELAPPFSTTANTSEYFYAVYSGDNNYATASTVISTTAVTISQATKSSTNNTLTASPSSLSYGNTTVLTSTISTTSTTAYATTSDSDTFYVDGVASGAAVHPAGGAVGVAAVATSATIPVSVLTGGSHSITSYYAGDTNLLGATGAITFIVTPATTAVTLTTTTSSPVVQGTGITFSSTIPYTSGNVAPTGTITYTVDGTVISTPAVLTLYAGGVGASFSTGQLSAGSHIITANYSGDKNYASSIASSTMVITSSNTQIALNLSTTQSSGIVLGAPVTIGVVAQSLNSGPVPTGSISYSVDGGTLTTGVALTNGSTSFVLSGLSILRHVVTVIYSGDVNYATTTQTLILNGGANQAILFPALPNTTKAVAPTVSLAARATSGLPVTYAVSGPASLSGSILTISGTGTITVTASQAGNSSFNPATSVTWSFTAQ